MTNEEIKLYFHGNRCFKFDGTWDEFQEFIHGHGVSHSTLKIIDQIYFDCINGGVPEDCIDNRVTEIL